MKGNQDTRNTSCSGKNFSFYPNPTNNQINFNNRYSFTTLNIYNVSGKLVSTTSLTEGENTVQTNLPSGVYFARFSNESASTVQKLVIK